MEASPLHALIHCSPLRRGDTHTHGQYLGG